MNVHFVPVLYKVFFFAMSCKSSVSAFFPPLNWKLSMRKGRITMTKVKLRIRQIIIFSIQSQLHMFSCLFSFILWVMNRLTVDLNPDYPQVKQVLLLVKFPALWGNYNRQTDQPTEIQTDRVIGKFHFQQVFDRSDAGVASLLV